MNRSIRRMTAAVGLLIGVAFIQTKLASAEAAPSTGQQPGSSARIEKSIAQAIGAEATSVKVTVGSSIVLVFRINSNMNNSTHEGRNNESKVIGLLVAKEIAGIPTFRSTTTIRVDYLVRSSTKAKDEIVDSVEFRKGPDGVFDFHQS